MVKKEELIKITQTIILLKGTEKSQPKCQVVDDSPNGYIYKTFYN